MYIYKLSFTHNTTKAKIKQTILAPDALVALAEARNIAVVNNYRFDDLDCIKKAPKARYSK